MGYTVETIRTRGLADVSQAMLRIGELTGRPSGAEAAAGKFRRRSCRSCVSLTRKTRRLRVFYQVSARPLYTVNREHYVSELIEICGGKNVFDDLEALAPAISVEAVVDRNPEVMLASTDAGDDGFRRVAALACNFCQSVRQPVSAPADEIARATPRLIVAAGAVCLALQQARFNRDAFSGE